MGRKRWDRRRKRKQKSGGKRETERERWNSC
jgi:hypothetical protein